MMKTPMKDRRALRGLMLLVCGYVFAIPVISLAGEGRRGVSPTPSDETEVRSTVQSIFDQLKAGQYEALYDALPSSSRARLSRDRFVAALQRTRNLYQLDRIEIGAVRVSGNLAVVHTVMYARIAKPFDADGKLVVQQYLLREDGRWRAAIGDAATINSFLKTNPSFARRFPIKKPRAFVKQDGQWVEFNLRRR